MKSVVQCIALFGGLLFSYDQAENYRTIDFGQSSLEVPDKWRQFSQQGYDSKTGGITNGRDTLLYDYSWYSYDFKNEYEILRVFRSVKC